MGEARGMHSESQAGEDRIRALLAGRTVLVTGADGFVGSHLTEALIEYGADVHVLVRPTSSGMLHNIGHLRHRITVHRGDIRAADAAAVAVQVLRSRHLGDRGHRAASDPHALDAVVLGGVPGDHPHAGALGPPTPAAASEAPAGDGAP